MYHGDGSYPWVLVPYERMVSRGREELCRIAQALDVERTSEMQEQLDESSQSVKDQLHRDAERQLSKWQRRLSEKQVEDILRIVEEVGLSEIYTRELEPDYDRLNEMQNPEAQW